MYLKLLKGSSVDFVIMAVNTTDGQGLFYPFLVIGCFFMYIVWPVAKSWQASCNGKVSQKPFFFLKSSLVGKKLI